MQVKKEYLELHTEKQIGSKLWKKYIKAVYCHPANLNYMQSMAYEMLDWKTHKWIQGAGRNINNLRYSDDTTLMYLITTVIQVYAQPLILKKLNGSMKTYKTFQN